jgi:hypothetical protein
MQEYEVEVPEIYVATYVVEAHTPAGAIQAVWDGEGEQLTSVFSHGIESKYDNYIPRPCVDGVAKPFPQREEDE